jgi:hypothetical protein
MSSVTRMLTVAVQPNQAKLDRLRQIALAVRELRSDVWRILVERENCAVPMYDFRDLMKERGLDQHHYGIPQRIWRQNVEATFKEVRLWQESAKANYKLKQKIFRRAAGNKAEERRLFTLLKTGDWLSDPWLHKHTRRAFKAKPKPNRQKLRVSFDSGTYDIQRDSKTGLVWVSLMVHTNGSRVRLCLGKLPEKLMPTGEIQLFLHAENDLRIHTGFDEYNVCAGDAIPVPGPKQSIHTKMKAAKAAREAKAAGLPGPEVKTAVPAATEQTPERKPKPYAILGIDSGRTEVFMDSHGTVYGHGFGELCAKDDAKRVKKNASRSKLLDHAKDLRKRADIARAAGQAEKAARLTRKADNVYAHNLGNLRQTAAKVRFRAQVRDIIFRATHEVAAVADVVVHEQFSNSFSYNRSRKQNRLNSGWMRSILAEAIESATRRRGSSALGVNPAYTSQQIRACGHLGKRTNGSVYCTRDTCPEYRVRYHDDIDAAGSIEDRAADPHITLSMTPKQVREVILSRY